jgi:hypothetical protein
MCFDDGIIWLRAASCRLSDSLRIADAWQAGENRVLSKRIQADEVTLSMEN